MKSKSDILVDKWIEALESGNYEQGRGYLRERGKYCCLGVACEVVNLESEEDIWESTRFLTDIKYNSEEMPTFIMDMYNIIYSSGTFDFKTLSLPLQEEINALMGWKNNLDERFTSLVDLNDGRMTFVVIAKVIRERPKGLFRENSK